MKVLIVLSRGASCESYCYKYICVKTHHSQSMRPCLPWAFVAEPTARPGIEESRRRPPFEHASRARRVDQMGRTLPTAGL